MFNYDLPRTLKKTIAEKGHTSIEIRKATGISEAQISQYIHDQHVPSAYNLLVLADFLGVTTDYLLTGKEEKR